MTLYKELPYASGADTSAEDGDKDEDSVEMAVAAVAEVLL